MSIDTNSKKKAPLVPPTPIQLGSEIFHLKVNVAKQHLMINGLIKKCDKAHKEINELILVVQMMGVAIMLLIFLCLAVAGGLI